MKKTFQYFNKQGILTEVKANSKKEVLDMAIAVGDNIKMSEIACPDAKEHRIDLVSRYNGVVLSLMVTIATKRVMYDAENAIDIINEACDRIAAGYPSRVLSYSQYLKIKNFFGKENIDYFDKVVF